MAQLHDVAIGLDDFVGIAGPQHHQPGNGAQRHQLFHRLMRWAVLAIAHGVVGENENGWQLHQGREPDGRLGVIAEDEECRSERPQLRQRKSVHRRRHGVFADAIMQILSAVIAGLEISGTFVFQRGPVRGAEVRRAADQPGNILRQHIQHLAGSIAPGDAFRVGGKDGQIAVPACGNFAPLHLVNLRSRVPENFAR